jgi:hypothetical protein
LENINPERIAAFFSYVSQFEESRFSDYSVVLVKTALEAFKQANRSKEFLNHPEFDAWLERNSDIILF